MIVGQSERFNFHFSDIHFFKSCGAQSTIVVQRKSFNFHLSDIPFLRIVVSKVRL